VPEGRAVLLSSLLWERVLSTVTATVPALASVGIVENY
jgi:hypothetical protein